MYRSVMSSSKQNLLSNISVVLRTQDFSVTDSVSPWKEEKKKLEEWMGLLFDIRIFVKDCIMNTVEIICDIYEFCDHSQASPQICGQRSPCAGSSALWQMCSNVWPNLNQREVALVKQGTQRSSKCNNQSCVSQLRRIPAHFSTETTSIYSKSIELDRKSDRGMRLILEHVLLFKMHLD